MQVVSTHGDALPDHTPGPIGPATVGPATDPDPTDVLISQAAAPSGATAAHSSLVATTGGQCPACGALMAADQRYCVECGQRRGDPRLPFMDAVVLMDTVIKGPRQAAPPPPPKKRRRMSANATLVAGIGTLLLALGVGVLIGRSGERSGSSASTTPVVVKVPNGGGEATRTTAETSTGKGTSAGATSSKANKAAAAKTGTSGQSKAAENVLHPVHGVKLPKPEAKVGETCTKGTAGCTNGKFKGEFFGGG
ncbi:MAG TPA: hypothetical protein VND98_11350 [Solirubrobacterales bacterium]|nr:hypothetical protein [Solirubrobacterales bacterium]